VFYTLVIVGGRIMILIALSLLMGYIGLTLGGMIGADIYVYLFGIVGVLSPGLFALEPIYREVKKVH